MKCFLKKIKISISRFFSNIRLSFKFIKKSSLVMKIKHATGIEFLKIGKNVFIDDGCRLDCYKVSEKDPCFEIGNNVRISFNFTGLCSSKLVIQDDVLIASDVFVSTENHGVDDLTKNYLDQELVSKDVVISKGAWIGEKVCVLPGVTVGVKSIIGANSVVTKDVPDYTMVVGNPAKIIKKYDFNKKKRVKYEEEN